mmetsp:Transcript_37015/g.86459  ORF Transcript_37015/g.86459 Transcript_37015/m.86459 type:complete len:301 (-) Transcript_37015:261-1163(-)
MRVFGINGINLVVLGAYVVNTACTFLSQLLLPHTNGELSKKYQSLVTPSGWAFAIWGLIFSLELAYAVAQLLPALRDADEVKSAAPWFIAACLFQALWSIAFGYELIYTALALILGILVSLAGANAAVQAVARAKGPPSSLIYALFVLPLTIHFGWLTAASVVACNLTVVYASPTAHASLLAVAIISLVVVLLPALSNPATAPNGADAGYALTVAWALAGVSAQLKSPMAGAPLGDPIPSWCPDFVTDALAAVAAVLVLAIVGVTASRSLSTLVRLVLRAQPSSAKPVLSESLVHVRPIP